jgi:DNA (cytosine-5)-methyltransferase 1
MRFSDYLQIKEAAALLGVAPGTLRNWERVGKVRVYRHPVNNYRLYKRTELEQLLGQVERERVPNSESHAPSVECHDEPPTFVDDAH